MTKSQENLKEAFAGESQASMKYNAFAKQADKEGHPMVAKLFRAAAAAEVVHANNHLRTLKGIGDTAANLQEAIDGETGEFTEMYPRMIEDAKAEGDTSAERTFVFANEVEKTHAKLYKEALDNLAEEKAEADYWVCSVCGHTVEGEAPDKCPVCNAGKKAFFKVD